MAVVNSVCQDDRTCQLDHRHVYNRHCPPRCLSNRTRYDSDTHALSDERANRCIGLSAIHGEGGVPSVDHVSTLKRSRRRRGDEREREPEGGALAFSAAKANPAVMLLDDRTADI